MVAFGASPLRFVRVRFYSAKGVLFSRFFRAAQFVNRLELFLDPGFEFKGVEGGLFQAQAFFGLGGDFFAGQDPGQGRLWRRVFCFERVMSAES